MFPEFKRNRLYALDLDGVIIDSIHECFKISITTYYDYQSPSIIPLVEKLFYKYRGMVGPAFEYYYLMCSISQFIKNDQIDLGDYFANLKKMNISKEAINFETQFFANRRKFQEENINEWVSLNPLTHFGEYLKKNYLNNMIIVTTKNTDSAKQIMKHHQIHPQDIYGNDEVKKAGSKGNLLNTILNQSPFEKMIFIDDSVEHLNTVKNKSIQCYFADWGYGEKNNEYISYKV